MAYIAAAFAFIISMLGALMNIAKVVYYIEGSIDTWIGQWKDGAYNDIIADKDSERYGAMEFFLTSYTTDLILWAIASVWHTGFIIASGYLAAFWIYYSFFCCSADDRTYIASVPARYGWKAMLFGVLVGSINFLSGSIMKSTAQSVMLMLGFLDHEGTGSDNKKITTITVINGVPSTSVVNTDPNGDTGTEFPLLLDLQENWFTFYIMIRGTQLIAPFIFLLTTEGAMVATFALFFVYF